MTIYEQETKDVETPSQFLPNSKIAYAWDSTSIGYLKTCPRLYQYTMIEGWTPKEDSVHLRFGGEFHQALWGYDHSLAAGLSHEDAVHDVIRQLLIDTADFKSDPDTKAGKYKNRESLIRTVIYYLDHRRDDALKTLIMDNGKPAVELSFRHELSFGPEAGIQGHIEHVSEDFKDAEYVQDATQPYILCGHLDRVCTDPDGNIFIEDHKTTTTTPGSYFFDNFEPNNQMSLYSYGGRVVMDMPIRGVAINAVQLLIEHPYNRFIRGFTFRNEDQLEEWMTDLSRWLQLAEWYATNDYWPQNDCSCDKFGGCKFRKVCSKAPSVREIYLKSDFTKLPEDQRWNPLRSR